MESHPTMDTSTLKIMLQRKSRIRGCSFNEDALDEAVSFASRFHLVESDAVDFLLEALQKDHQSLQPSIIDKDEVLRVVSIVFEGIEERPNTITTIAPDKGCLQCGEPLKALEVVFEMTNVSVRLNKFTLTTALDA